MASITTTEQLQRAIGNDLEAAVRREVFDACMKAMQQVVKQQVYGNMASNGSEFYTRTFDFYNAIRVDKIKKSGNQITFEIYIKASELDAKYVAGQLPAHVPAKGSWNTEDGLIETIEDGSSGKSKIYNWPATHFMRDAEKDMDDVILRGLLKGMKARGWDAHIM